MFVSLVERAVEEDGRPRAYEGIVSFNIPLRWGLRDARQAEATAETSAARARRTATDLDLAAGLREALAALATQRRIEILLMRQAKSEEHTSELQSLMRISYAVFCLKKKQKKTKLDNKN